MTGIRERQKRNDRTRRKVEAEESLQEGRGYIESKDEKKTLEGGVKIRRRERRNDRIKLPQCVWTNFKKI